MNAVHLINGVYESGLHAARNWSVDEAGSIHDDATASKLGFRGGTVAGSIHMDQFVPALLAAYGEEWFRTGWFSLYFENATTDGERVKVFVQEPVPGGPPAKTWMEREDGMRVMSGNAGLGDASASELATRDLRGGDPAGLRILAGMGPGFDLGTHIAPIRSNRLTDRIAAGLVGGVLPWYTDPAHWGGLVGSPSMAVELLWGPPTARLSEIAGEVVGLFGAIEVAHVRGPIILDETYQVSAQVVEVGQSPKTEYFWFDSSARNRAGDEVARMRMQLRFMKASSPRYAD